jgi:hypothetical protein
MSVTYLRDGKEFSYREAKEIVDARFADVNKNIEAILRDGFVTVFPSPKPECGELERAVRDGITTDDNGNTVQAWKVVDMFNDYQAEKKDVDGEQVYDADGSKVYYTVTKAEQEAEYLAKLQEQKVKATEQEIQNHINEVVKDLGYDDENSISKYLVSGNPFYDECSDISLWIGTVWVTAFTIQQQVLAGTREEPEDIISELPIYGE